MPYIYKSGLQFGINETNIYGGASYVELTQAEYDALSDAEKHNGQIYFITDGNYDFLIVNDSVPIGSIQAYGGMSAPTNWLICDGSAVSRTDYKELFQIIGVSFGEGDGVTTFNLPDFRGRVLTGAGSLNSIIYELGKQKDAGLPNITAIAHANTTYSGTPYSSGAFSGAFYSTPMQGTQYYLNGRATGSGWSDIGLDASRSSSIYGNSTTVQPNTTVANYIIKAKNPSITSGQQLQAMELFYPVGSYFETSDSTFDPNVEWGGTWVSKTIENNDIISETPTITGSNSGNWSSLTKVGKMVQFRLSANFNMSLAAGTNTPIGSVPEGFRPISEVTVGGYIVGGTYGFIFIEPDGTIMLQRVAAGTGNLVRQNIVYFTSQNEVEKICWHRTA